MHLIDEEDGAPAILCGLLLGHFHRLADFLDPGEHRRNRLEVRLGDLRQQLGQGGLADARRAPEDHRVQSALLQRFAQRLALAQHMLLTDVLIQAGRAQTSGQGLGDGGRAKQVHTGQQRPLIRK